MAIVGVYSGSALFPEPTVKAVVEIHRLGIWGWVDFLIDTGTDRTTLYPGRGNSIAIPYSALRQSTLRTATGVGGEDRFFAEQAVLTLPGEGNQSFRCMLDIDIWRPDSRRFGHLLPSLLGRDFLNLCDVRMNYSRNLVSLDPLNVENGFVLPP